MQGRIEGWHLLVKPGHFFFLFFFSSFFSALLVLIPTGIWLSGDIWLLRSDWHSQHLTSAAKFSKCFPFLLFSVSRKGKKKSPSLKAPHLIWPVFYPKWMLPLWVWRQKGCIIKISYATLVNWPALATHKLYTLTALLYTPWNQKYTSIHDVSRPSSQLPL